MQLWMYCKEHNVAYAKVCSQCEENNKVVAEMQQEEDEQERRLERRAHYNLLRATQLERDQEEEL